MLKKLIILVFAIAPLASFAQDKIAYINTNEVFAMMPEVKDADTQLKAKQEEIKKTLQSIQTEYENKAKEFQADTAAVTASIVADRKQQLQQLEARYQNFLQSSDSEVQDLRKKLLAPVQQKLQAAIKAVGDAQGYSFILEASTLPYIGTKAINVTTLVKTKLGIK